METGLNGIAETLLIPVRARAYETKLPDPLLQDPWAVRIMNELALRKSDKDKVFSGTLIGIILRTLLFDSKIKTFMQEHPDGIVVNLGCGLDARYNRLCPASVFWFDLDIEEVMNLRKHFFEETANYRMLSGSMFDDTWMAQIPEDKPIMVFFEGVSMYFAEDMIKPFILRVFRKFPQTDMVFDVLAKVSAKSTRRHPDIRKYNAPFKWGIDSADELRDWDSGIRVISEESYIVKKPLRRWPLVLRLLRWLPVIQQMGRVIHIQYEGSAGST